MGFAFGVKCVPAYYCWGAVMHGVFFSWEERGKRRGAEGPPAEVGAVYRFDLQYLPTQDQDRVDGALHLPAFGPWITGKVESAAVSAVSAKINNQPTNFSFVRRQHTTPAAGGAWGALLSSPRSVQA